MSIEIRKLSHIYNEGMTFAKTALDEIDCTIENGEMLALIGETGSGKSTLVQHLNALLIPTQGEICIGDHVISSKGKNKNLKQIRKKVGLVFQFPEYQLFEETIEKDIAFGPINFGVDKEEANKIAEEMIQVVGLDKSYLQKSPFECSGGEKRRIAIAGILAMNPDVLVFDEPTAGLDPKGAKDMMELFRKLNEEMNKTVIIVSHDMEHVLTYCKRVIVMNHGKIIEDKSVKEFFQDSSILKKLNINPPCILQMKDMLIEKGFKLDSEILDLDQLTSTILKELEVQ